MIRPLAGALVVIAALAAPARAHQTPVKYADVHVDGADVQIELRFQPADVTRPLGVPDGATPTVADTLAAADRVLPYVHPWIAVAGDGAPCVAGAPTLTPAKIDDRYLSARWTVRCPAPVARLSLRLAAFFAVDRSHEMVLRLTSPGAPAYPATIGVDDDPFEFALTGERPSTVWAWIWEGMNHIYGGPDHIAFVLTLLLLVVIGRGRQREWIVRPLGSTLRLTATVITSFTVAHSLTLIAASLGWFRLPQRPVEILIALSILYTAIEDILKPDVRWRHALTFGFGLVHGLGFAGVLSVLLPPDEVVVPLLEFNVGVEIGQLTIVAAVVPVLAVVARRVGADAYRRRVMPVLAVALALFGAIWTFERVTGVSILGL